MPIESLIRAFALPGLAVTAWCFIIWMPWSAKQWGGRGEQRSTMRVPRQEAWRIALTAIGVAIAFAFSHRAIDGRWPDVPPTLTTNINAWIFFLAIIASFAGALDAIIARAWHARLLVRIASCAAVSAIPVLLLMQGEHSFYHSALAFDPKSGPLWIIAGTLISLGWWYAFTPLRREESRLPFIVPLGIFLGIAAPTMVLWTVAINAQFLGAAALALVPAGLITLWRPHARISDALAGFAVLMTLAAASSSYHFADEYPSALSAAFLALAPFGMLIVWLRKFRPTGEFKRAALTTALVSLFATAALGVSAWEYFEMGEDFSSPNEDDPFYEYYGQ